MSKAEFNQATLTSEDLDRKFTAVFPGHRSFDAFDDVGGGAAIVFKLLGTVVDGDSSAFADVFVGSALIGVLKTAPTTDVVNEDGSEIRGPAANVVNQLLQRVATVKP